MSEESNNQLAQSHPEHSSKIYVHPDHLIIQDREDLVFVRAVEVEDTVGLVKLGEDEPYMRLDEEADMSKSEAEEFVENTLIEVSIDAVENPRKVLNRALNLVNAQSPETSVQELVDLEFARKKTNIVENKTVLLEEEKYI